MAEYLASGRSPEGKSVTQRVEAASADEAARVLRDRGYTDVVLHDDDVSALYGPKSDPDNPVTPRQYLWFRRLPGSVAGFLVITLNLYRKSWLVTLAGVFLLIYRRQFDRPWGVLDTLIVAILLIPVVFGLITQLVHGATEGYTRLIESIAWGRWQEALERIDSVRFVPREEITFRQAQALAGLGRLDEALELVAPFGDGEKMPEWLYHSRLADLHETARRYDDAHAEMERALELAPDNATILLDLARQEVWHHRNPRRARELLAAAREHTLSDLLGPVSTLIEGLIELEEGRPREARPHLEEAYRGIAAFRHASPLIGTMLDMTHSALTLACAGEGDLSAARSHYRRALPRLEALRLDHLVARCNQAFDRPGEV